MTELEVNRIIDKDFDDFNQAVYGGEKLPDDIIELFKKAIFKMPPTLLRASSETLKRLAKTKPEKLTNYEVGFVLNQVSAVPFCDLYPDLWVALSKTKQIEQLKVAYNVMIKSINETMDKKKESLLNLSGNGNMKIIPSSAQA